MTSYGEVEIKELVKVLFQKTYETDATYLYDDEKMCEIIRNAVKVLRKSYKPSYRNSGCESTYHNEEVRNAYMISYYPYYFEPVHRIVEEIIMPKLIYKEKIFIDCFAGGPCPEVYGAIKAISKSVSIEKVDVVSYDLEQGWARYRNITNDLCRQLVKELTWLFVYNFDITATADSLLRLNAGSIKLCERWKNQTDIFLLQNYLSHIDENDQEVNNFLKWFVNLANCMKTGAFFLCVDLNYISAKKVFMNFSDQNFLKMNNLRIFNSWLPINGEELKIRHGDTLDVIKDKIFIGQIRDGSDLVQKKNTKFYYVVLQKI